MGGGGGILGITNHRRTEAGMPGTNEPIPEHIQSYFYCFDKKVVSSKVFQDFWGNVENLSDVNEVIQKYETQLTGLLTQAGFQSKVLFETSGIESEEKDISNWRPDIILENNVPFLKVKSLLHFPLPPKLIQNMLKEKTDYPIRLMYNHLNDIYSPHQTLLLEDKLILVEEKHRTTICPKLRMAIHLHVFYVDVFEKYLEYFDKMSESIDLFCTTDTEEKKNSILSLMQNRTTGVTLKDVIIVENRGRDILPWLLLSECLNAYDIVGHFHTKKTAWASGWIGKIWQQDILYLLLSSINQIIDAFDSNEKTGIIIPEIPYYFRITYYDNLYGNKPMQIMLKELWEKMGCRKDIDFTRMPAVIFPYGTMFWYRPRALKPLFDLRLSADDVPPEPLPKPDTILNAIERAVVYIAWNQGYDYRIMAPKIPFASSFIDEIKHGQAYNELCSSRAYRLGRFLLAFPRHIKKMFRKFVVKMGNR
jgi:rhamnosyltransferase